VRIPFISFYKSTGIFVLTQERGLAFLGSSLWEGPGRDSPSLVGVWGYPPSTSLGRAGGKEAFAMILTKPEGI